MKKKSLLILLLFFALKVSAQTCFYHYNGPGSTTVSFTPDSFFLMNAHSYLWSFGDGTSDTQATPSHTYNSFGPYVVCCTIYDSINVIMCSSCDTILMQSSPNCSFTVTPVSGTGFVFQMNQTVANHTYHWDFADSTTATGNPITHVYSTNGSYMVCLIDYDSSGAFYCSTCQQVNVGPVTPCSFTAVRNPASTLMFNFTANVPSNATVTWNFGDNTVSSGLQATHPYATSGTYLVCMNVSTQNGGTCSFCDSVVAGNATLNCMFSFAPDTSIANTIIFAGQPAFFYDFITWDFGDGNTGAGNTLNHTYSIPGYYNVCMNETDSIGNIICTSCNMIVVGNTTNNCNWTVTQSSAANTYDFTGSPAYSFDSIQWTFGDGTAGSGQQISHTWATGGVYAICMNEVDSNGVIVCARCTSMTVGANGNCNFTATLNPISPLTIDFQANSGFLSTVTWDFGDSTFATGLSATHTYAVAGVYQVCITVVTPGTSNCTYCSLVTVPTNGPGNCRASFLSASFGLTAYFIDNSISNSNNTLYSWDFGDGSSSTNRFPQHIYSSPGTYTTCLTIYSNSTNCSDTFCAPVIVDTVVAIPTTCNAFFAIVQLAPFQVTIVNFASGLNLSFSWDYGDGSPLDTLPYPSHYYSNIGRYNLCLTVSDQNGCSSTFCDSLSVDSLGNIYRRAQSGFSINVVSPASLTGVNEINVNHLFRAYPNPVQTELHVNILSGDLKPVSYRVITLQSTEILYGKLNGSEAHINMQPLSAGTYFLEVTFNDGSRSYQSIIKN